MASDEELTVRITAPELDATMPPQFSNWINVYAAPHSLDLVFSFVSPMASVLSGRIGSDVVQESSAGTEAKPVAVARVAIPNEIVPALIDLLKTQSGIVGEGVAISEEAVGVIDMEEQ